MASASGSPPASLRNMLALVPVTQWLVDCYVHEARRIRHIEKPVKVGFAA
jgi:hypothetical protein